MIPPPSRPPTPAAFNARLKRLIAAARAKLPRTAESVAKELYDGLKDGSIVLGNETMPLKCTAAQIAADMEAKRKAFDRYRLTGEHQMASLAEGYLCVICGEEAPKNTKCSGPPPSIHSAKIAEARAAFGMLMEPQTAFAFIGDESPPANPPQPDDDVDTDEFEMPFPLPPGPK